MEAATEDELRLARRLKLGVRLVVYPTLLGLIVLALHARHVQGVARAGTAPVVWRGVGRDAVQAEAVTSAGRLVLFAAPLVERCNDGATFTMRWRVGERGLVQVGTAASARVVQRPGTAGDGGATTYDMTFDASVGKDAIDVTLSGSVLWTRATSHRVVWCNAGPVRMTLARQ
ncbi:MAG TPA: hypothetical protein VI318_11955 [Baekduia sp.]